MQVKVNSSSAYAPIRYESTRPYSVHIGKAFAVASSKGEAARIRFLQTEMIPLAQMGVARLGRTTGPGPVQEEIVNLQVFGSFLQGGRIIFDMVEVLTKTMLQTDADDIPCSELRFPCDDFYLHFGANSGLESDGLNIEGAFISKNATRLAIELVPEGFGRKDFFRLSTSDSVIGVGLNLAPEKSVSTALTDSIAEIMDANLKYFAEMEKVERQLEAQYGQVVKVPVSVLRLGEHQPLLLKALGLIVNALFYLTAEPDDIVEDWSQDAPKEALAALSAADKPGTRKTLENTLLKAGYTKVRFVGRKFAQSTAGQQISASVASGRSLATHFRRAHFRRQPYGPERSLRKTIFVAPVLVNAASGDEPAGRVYKVQG